jgi:chromosome segregation ATPase
MVTPEDSQELLHRLTCAEDAVQRFEFIHLVKTDAQTAGLGILYAQQRRMQEELSGFRAEVTTELETIKSELGTVKSGLGTVHAELGTVKSGLGTVHAELGTVKSGLGTVQSEQAQQGEKLDRVEASLGQVQETLAEVLRRLPEPGRSS